MFFLCSIQTVDRGLAFLFIMKCYGHRGKTFWEPYKKPSETVCGSRGERKACRPENQHLFIKDWFNMPHWLLSIHMSVLVERVWDSGHVIGVWMQGKYGFRMRTITHSQMPTGLSIKLKKSINLLLFFNIWFYCYSYACGFKEKMKKFSLLWGPCKLD